MSRSPQYARSHEEAEEKSLSFQVERGPEAALSARRALLAGDGWLPSDVREDVMLLMTELITNAVRHGGDERERPLTTEVRWRDGRAFVEVMDPSAASEIVRHPPRHQQQGRLGALPGGADRRPLGIHLHGVRHQGLVRASNRALKCRRPELRNCASGDG